jgi:RNA polymerase sigma-70 factor (ECF subfamily)
MECRQLFAQLSEYLDGELPASMCDEFARHVEGCEPCEAFIRTLKETVALCRALPDRRMPEHLRRDLVALFEHTRRAP